MQTHAKGEWSEGAVSKSVRQLFSHQSVSQFLRQSARQSGRGGIFTRSKDLGERQLVFTTFLTSAWKGGGWRRDEGGGGEVRDRGETGGCRAEGVMTTTTTTTTTTTDAQEL